MKTPRTGGKASTAAGVIRLLAGSPGIETEADTWDADSRVGIDGDVLDLRTGAITPARLDYRIRRRVAARPASPDDYQRSKWRRIIEHAVPDASERSYLQCRLGRALLREGGDDCLWLAGPSGSGKGCIIAGLMEAFGSYAAAVPASEVTIGGHKGHAQWRYRLRGCRLMLIDDAPPRDIDASAINGLLGSVMTANPMRQGSVDFRVTAPLLITANRAPSLPAEDGGFRRRLKPIQCGDAIPQSDQDPDWRSAMTSAAEQASVVRWLMDGIAMGAYAVPVSVAARVEDVMDAAPLSEFVDLFTADAGHSLPSDTVWHRWQDFKRARGENAGSRRVLVNRLKFDYQWKPVKGTAGQRRLRVAQRPRVAQRGTPDLSSDRARESRTHGMEISPAPRAPLADDAPLADLAAGALGSANGGGDPPADDLAAGALGTANGGGDHRPPPSTPPADDSAIPPPRHPEVSTMPDDPPAPPITHPPDGDHPAPPAADGRGEFVGILPANPAVTNPADCPRCFGTGQTATGARCLDCQPLAVFIDRARPLSADDLARATAYMDRLRATAAASNGNGPAEPPRITAAPPLTPGPE